MAPTYKVCVYGSSSARTPEKYLKVAKDLGLLLAEGGHLAINGGGLNGCMGALNDGIHERNGLSRGVIHEMFIVDKNEHPSIRDMKVVGGDGLQERKRALVEEADCVIALPGGPGTWDELFEIVCLKGIGLCELPVCAVDVDRFYEGVRMQIKRAHEDGLLYAEPSDLLHFEPDADAALRWCLSQLGDAGKSIKKVQPVVRQPADRVGGSGC
ncbi:unnamed protein product [Discosporangium mesarthrocarpum]